MQQHCLACGKNTLFSVVNFGLQPAVNKLVSNDSQPEPKFELALVACSECSHSQMSTFVDPRYIFSDYTYASGTSQTLKNYFNWLAQFAKDNCSETDKILEIASNDGSFLASLKDKGVACFGIDPAEELVKEASKTKEVECMAGFWPQDFHSKETFKGIVCQNVVAHTPNPYDFIKATFDHLSDDGFLLVQTSQINMVEKGQFDTLYHEHYSFFTQQSIKSLMERCGFTVRYQFVTDIHGDSLITIATKQPQTALNTQALQTKPFFIEERNTQTPLNKETIKQAYDTFNQKSMASIQATKDCISKHPESKIVFVGAAAKALTFLNVSGIKPDFLVDEALLKIGKYDPNKNFLIQSLTVLAEQEAPLLCIISAWNFYTELKSKISTLRGSKPTVYFRYFPEPELSNS